MTCEVYCLQNSSGIYSPHCSSAKVQEFLSKWAIHQNSKDELSSCRCSVTSHGDLKTVNRNADTEQECDANATCVLFYKKIPTKTFVISWTWIRKVVFYLY